MSDVEKIAKGRPIGNLLYTREADVSREKTQAELEIEDPKAEKALGVLNRQGGEQSPQTKDEEAADE